MEEHLIFVRSSISYVKGLSDFTFKGPNSAIISVSFYHIEP